MTWDILEQAFKKSNFGILKGMCHNHIMYFCAHIFSIKQFVNLKISSISVSLSPSIIFFLLFLLPCLLLFPHPLFPPLAPLLPLSPSSPSYSPSSLSLSLSYSSSSLLSSFSLSSLPKLSTKKILLPFTFSQVLFLILKQALASPTPSPRLLLLPPLLPASSSSQYLSV